MTECTRNPALTLRDPLLLVVVTAYLVLVGYILLRGEGIPYVVDNNESFGLYVHAYNLHHFGLADSWGLTDESTSPDPEAHPYLYTHQGKFTRLLPFVLYSLGLRSIEAHIAISAYSMGLLGYLLAYLFFRRTAGRWFAALFCLLLLTDYYFFLQWAPNIDRNCNAYFLFSSLLAVHALGMPRRPPWLAPLIALNFALLFTNEITFAVFVCGVVGSYAVWVYRRQPGAILRIAGVSAGGVIVGAASLLAQQLGALGIDTTSQDFAQTFLARNLASDDPQVLAKILNFYAERNIVFWPNFMDGSVFHDPAVAFVTYANFNLQVLTPLLCMLVFAVCTGWMLGGLVPASERVLDRLLPDSQGHQSLAVALTLGVCSSVVIWILIGPVMADSRALGHPPEAGLGGLSWKLGLAAILAGGALTCGLLARPRRAAARLAPALLWIVTVRLAVDHHWLLYASNDPVPDALIPGQSDPALAKLLLAVILAGGLGRIVGLGRVSPPRAVSAALVYLLSSFLGLVLVYVLLPGYLVTGYMVLGDPLCVFVQSSALAIGAFLVAYDAVLVLSPKNRAFSALTPVGVLPCVGLAILWVSVQLGYLRLLPPEHALFLKRLREAPYAGRTFVVNGYPMAPRVMTGAWAYYDPRIGSGQVVLGQAGYEVGRDLFTFLWFSDRDRNPDYSKPDYFLCFMSQTRTTTAARLSGQWRRAGPEVDLRCGDVELIRRIRSGEQEYLFHEISSTDPTERDAWTIVKLDWDFPPFLERTPGQAFLRAHFDPNRSVQLDYTYAHQEGKPEASSVRRLYRVGTADSCPGVDEVEDRIEIASEAGGRLEVPSSLSGAFQLSVSPATASKQGPEYYSDIYIWPRGTLSPQRCGAPAKLCAPDSCTIENLELEGFRARRSGSAVALEWNRVPNADRYEVESLIGGEATLLGQPGPRTTRLDTNVERGTLRARVCSLLGCSPWSSLVLPVPEPLATRALPKSSRLLENDIPDM